MEHATLTLIDKLIAHWSNWDYYEEYYLNVLAPSIVHANGGTKLKGTEKEIVTALRRQLSDGEWQQLPTLIAQRREALREEKRERERREQERRLAEEARIVRKRALVARLKEVFESDFLSADGVLAADPDAELVSSDEYAELKTSFVRHLATRELGRNLDSEQAAAVAATSGDVQVLARAGSGKTRTFVTRAISATQGIQRRRTPR